MPSIGDTRGCGPTKETYTAGPPFDPTPFWSSTPEALVWGAPENVGNAELVSTTYTAWVTNSYSGCGGTRKANQTRTRTQNWSQPRREINQCGGIRTALSHNYSTTATESQTVAAAEPLRYGTPFNVGAPVLSSTTYTAWTHQSYTGCGGTRKSNQTRTRTDNYRQRRDRTDHCGTDHRYTDNTYSTNTTENRTVAAAEALVWGSPYDDGLPTQTGTTYTAWAHQSYTGCGPSRTSNETRTRTRHFSQPQSQSNQCGGTRSAGNRTYTTPSTERRTVAAGEDFVWTAWADDNTTRLNEVTGEWIDTDPLELRNNDTEKKQTRTLTWDIAQTRTNQCNGEENRNNPRSETEEQWVAHEAPSGVSIVFSAGVAAKTISIAFEAASLTKTVAVDFQATAAVKGVSIDFEAESPPVGVTIDLEAIPQPESQSP